MGVVTTQVVSVTCDNPACPNKAQLPSGLVATSVSNWISVTVSVINGVTNSYTVCSQTCVNAVSATAVHPAVGL